MNQRLHEAAMELAFEIREYCVDEEDGLLIPGEVEDRCLKTIERIDNETRRQIEKEVLHHIAGIAATHSWFPINHVIKAIQGGVEP